MTVEKKFEKLLQSPARTIMLGFLLLIVLGTGLLALPASSADGRSVGLFDAAFTSTSAVCVTGLTVRNTAADFSRTGHVILIVLIQCGGLGFMTMTTVLFMLLGKKITLRGRMLIQESMNEENPGGMVRLIMWVLVCTFTIEMGGAVLLSIRMIPKYGFGDGVFYAVFHSISAFCNAGFDLFGNSIAGYADDSLMNIVLMALILLGGLGFGVISNVLRDRTWRRYRLQTKLVLSTTGVLFLLGAVCFGVLEWNNDATMGKMSAGGKILASLFQSVTFRTAGFNTVDLQGLRTASKLIACALMFVGAGPGSTGGGVKVSTIAVLFLSVRAAARGSDETTVFGRTVSKSTAGRAMVIVMICAMFLLTGLVVLSVLEEGYSLPDLAMEEFSALGTVGVSAAGTTNFGTAARILIMINMFVGRVGPLSVALAVSRKQSSVKDLIRYPEERIMVG